MSDCREVCRKFYFILYILLLSFVSFCLSYQVCDCQHQFARWEDGQQRSLPIFSGCQGPEFSSALLEIECSFQLSLQKLRSCEKAILDILDITWCSEFNK